MSFPIVSTAYYTPRCRRGNEVFQRMGAQSLVRSGAVYNCRKTSGTDLWSPHAFGDAVDLMLKNVSRKDAETVGRAAVRQATKRTVANRGRKIEAVHIIFGKTQWVKGEGTSPYGGIAHDNHVHVGYRFSVPQKPPCAG